MTVPVSQMEVSGNHISKPDMASKYSVDLLIHCKMMNLAGDTEGEN